MPNPINVPITAGNLPAGYCWPPDPQKYLTDIVSLLMATIPGGFSLFSFGPTPGDPGLPWLRTDSSGVIDGWYTFVGGDWIRPYPIPPSSPIRWLWMDTEANLWSFDNGDGTDPAQATPTSGSFWAIDHKFDGSVPVGPNDNVVPSPTPLIKLNSTGGAFTITLTDPSVLPDHRHVIPMYLNDNITTAFGSPTAKYWDSSGGHAAEFPSTVSHICGTSNDPYGPGTQIDGLNYYIFTNYASGGTSPPSTGPTAISVANPYVGSYFIKRSARQYIVAQ